MTVRILKGDCRASLRQLPPDSVHMAVTSPPYWGLRSYGVDPTLWGGDPACEHDFADETVERQIRKGMGLEELGKRYRGGGKKHGKIATFEIHRGSCVRCGCWRGDLGLEPTPELFVDHMVDVFEEVRRVLRPDGTLWLNIGDSYASGGGAGSQGRSGDRFERAHTQKYMGVNRGSRSIEAAGKHGKTKKIGSNRAQRGDGNDGVPFAPAEQPNRSPQEGLKAKDLVGIPWMLAFALRRAGWWLRQDIIWEKPNPMPESIEDRCTKSHEYVFLLTKSERYYYDAEAIKEDSSENSHPRRAANGALSVGPKSVEHGEGVKANVSFHAAGGDLVEKRNKRSVWTVATAPFPEAHFATFPTKLIEPTILAGTSERGCCRSCMAGWQRVVEKVDTGKRQKMADGWDTGEGGHGAFHRNGREKGESGVPVMTNQTVGWYPACGCAGIEPLPKYPQKPSEDDFEGDVLAFDAEVRRWNAACEIVRQARSRLCELVSPIKTAPAIVLDPFGGSGTTGLVADRLQRDSVLCELKPDYVDMAIKRISGDGGLFSRVAAE